MSTNKQQLQLNNTDLQSILSTVMGLPTQDSVKHGAYVWKKLTAEGGDFVDFIVSDNESAYPDGGTQDGYWYEKMVEGMQLELFGCTKMAIDEFTPTSDVYDYKTILNHSFGEIPKKAFILPKNDFTHPGNSKIYVKFGFLDYTDVYKTRMHYLYIRLQSSQTSSSGDYAELTGGSYSPTDKTLVLPSVAYFMAGVTYQIITMG